MPIDPEAKAKRAAQRKAAYQRMRLKDQVEDTFERQRDRIADKLAKVSDRIRQSRQRAVLADMEAQLELRKHVGSGGHLGRRCPTLEELDLDIGAHGR